ncbi:MAG: hypothetical protein CL607_18270 [Anaerolineaceae bacterium]|nr:hypothetical protein [Anaerolineaceae bacterium]
MKQVVVVLMLLFAVTVVRGQSGDLDEPWSIVEQCILQEGTPPADWSFDGMILTVNNGQLIGYSQNNNGIQSSVIQETGIPAYGHLSPDGLWYAIVKGSSEADGLVTVVTTFEIQVYSTIEDRHYVVPWENTYHIMRRNFGHQLYWLDNSHLLYSKDMNGGEHWFIIDPFSAEITTWDQPFTPTHFAFELTPDAQKGIASAWSEPYWNILSTEEPIETQTRTHFQALWHPSSEHFATTTWPKVSEEPEKLILVDLNGEIIHSLYRASKIPPGYFDARGMLWSPDGRYLAFADDHLYIADTLTQQVYDTCFSPVINLAWAPRTHQLALFEGGDNTHSLQVIDLDRAVSYIVDQRTMFLIGWRADDEE